MTVSWGLSEGGGVDRMVLLIEDEKGALFMLRVCRTGVEQPILLEVAACLHPHLFFGDQVSMRTSVSGGNLLGEFLEDPWTFARSLSACGRSWKGLQLGVSSSEHAGQVDVMSPSV